MSIFSILETNRKLKCRLLITQRPSAIKTRLLIDLKSPLMLFTIKLSKTINRRWKQLNHISIFIDVKQRIEVIEVKLNFASIIAVLSQIIKQLKKIWERVIEGCISLILMPDLLIWLFYKTSYSLHSEREIKHLKFVLQKMPQKNANFPFLLMIENFKQIEIICQNSNRVILLVLLLVSMLILIRRASKSKRFSPLLSLNSGIRLLEQQINITGLMQYKGSNNIVLDLNPLEQGLNFLVPRDWWAGFLTLNNKKESHDDIQIPNDHPLSFFFEIGLIQDGASDMRTWIKTHDSKLKAMEEHAQSTGYLLNDLVNQAAVEDLDKQSKKRNRPVFEWWDMNSITSSKGYNKILLSPFIDRTAFTDIFDNFEWRVVSPRLYKFICQNDFFKRGELYRDYIIGVPIFLQSSDLRHPRCQMSYCLSLQAKGSLYFYNTLGMKYAFIGAIQANLTYDKVMSYLFDGLNKMVVYEIIYPIKYYRNQIRMTSNKIYCNFEGEEQNCAKLQWESFSRFYEQITNEGFDITELSSFSKSELVQADKEELLRSKKSSKKIKPDQTQSKSLQKTVKKKGFQSPVFANKYKARLIRFNKIKQKNPKMFQEIINSAYQPQQHHYSTQEQTPSVIIQENPQIQQIIFQSKEQNRINFPIWKNYHSVQSLVKLSEIKMNESIPLPFCNSNKKIVKTKQNKRILITTNSNKIAPNQYGEYVQQQSEQQTQNRHIPQDVIKQLENMALEIRGEKKKMNIALLIKEDELEAAKDKIDIESRTCKNEEQEMDDLDEVQSREC